MASRFLSFGVFIYFVQIAFTFPHNIGHNNFGSLANIYNYPNNNGLNQRNTAANLAIANIGQNGAANGLSTANIGHNVAANSLATANVGRNNFASNTKASLAGSGNSNNNNRVTSSGLNHMDLRNFAKKPNANHLARNILGQSAIGSLGTSSASAQGLAREFTSYPQHDIVAAGAPVSLRGNPADNVYDDVGVTTAASSSVALDDEDFSPFLDCPDNMEMIGYVSFEGYLPVQGTVKVAESMDDCPA